MHHLIFHNLIKILVLDLIVELLVINADAYLSSGMWLRKRRWRIDCITLILIFVIINFFIDILKVGVVDIQSIIGLRRIHLILAPAHPFLTIICLILVLTTSKTVWVRHAMLFYRVHALLSRWLLKWWIVRLVKFISLLGFALLRIEITFNIELARSWRCELFILGLGPLFAV